MKLTLICLSTLVVFNNAFVNKCVTHSPTQLSSELQMTILTANGKKKNARAGIPLKNALGGLGVKPKYSCRKGECNSCTVSVGGQRIKACIGKVPPEPTLKSLKEKGLAVR